MTEIIPEKKDSKQIKSQQDLYGVDKGKPDFLSWHYGVALPSFLDSRVKFLNSTLKFFNLANLAKNLFTPYRRLTVTGKKPGFNVSGLFDRITFNLTSIFVGASVRLILIFVGIVAALLMTIFDFFSTVVYAVLPIISYPKYLKITQETFYDDDLKDSQKFLAKLKSSRFFTTLAVFFDEGFNGAFNSLPQPTTLGITTAHKPQQILQILFQKFPALSEYLEQYNVKQKEFEIITNFLWDHLASPKPQTTTPIGQMLTFGYTNTLDKFCTELTSQTLPPPSKKEALTQIEKILTRHQNNNVLLVGEPGVGRHNLLLNLASSIQKGILPALENRRVMLLDTIALAGTGENLIEVRSDFEAVLEEAKRAGNIILAIDQIDRISTARESRIDLSEVLSATLRDNTLPIIGITTLDDFNQFIRPSGLLLKLFEKIDVIEPPKEETIAILIAKSLEALNRQGIAIAFRAILEIVEKSTKLMAERKQPEKSIILLEDLVAEAKARKLAIVDVPLVDEILEQQTKIPLGAITKGEAEKLKNLENILHQRIIGQDEAIVQIAKSMRRARAEIEAGAKPIGSFLFLGPTGVGKTETAKALAEAYFGSEDRMVRLDMSEFQEENALARLIGDIGSQRAGQLASLIRQNPFGLLLVDEFEKATRDVHNLFLQILDEGFMTDAFGKKVSFDNVIIIATSNAGAEFIREQITKGEVTDLNKKLVDYILSKGLFSPELVNRFDGVVVYHPLSQNQAIAVANLMLKRLAKNLKDTKNISLELTPQLAQITAERGFDLTFGARPMHRLIADKIEDGIAKMIIDGTIKNGSKIEASSLIKLLG